MRILALAVGAFVLIGWLVTGANRGWTKTSVAVEKTDEITGLTYREYEQALKPGLDFLLAGFAAAALLGGISLLFRRAPAAVRDRGG